MTVTEPDGTAAGALYIPADEIVPAVEFPPGTPFTSQLIPVLLVPETVALNCWVWPVCKVALGGETETVTGGGCVIETDAFAEVEG